MATDLDELQIVITSNSNEASEALDKLVKGLENLDSALGKLDASKITSFANAMGKLSSIGTITNTTSKALRGMSTQISKAFGIKSADGIKEVNQALAEFYEATKTSSKDASLPTQKLYEESARALYKAIKENATYKKELEGDAKIINEIYNVAKGEGTKYSLKGLKDAFPSKDDFEEVKKSLGSVFSTAAFAGEKGLQNVDDLFDKIYEKTKNPIFFQDTANNIAIDYEKALKTVAEALDDAKNSSLKYDKAVDEQIIRGDEAKKQLLDIAEQLKVLVRQQNELSSENGLTGIVSVLKAFSGIKIPDMSSLADVLKALNDYAGSDKKAENLAKILSSISNSSNSISSQGISELASYSGQASLDLAKVAPSADNISKSMESVASSTNAATEEVEKLNNAFVLLNTEFILLNTEFIMLSDRTDLAIIDPSSLETALSVLKEISNFQPPDFSTNLEYYNEYAESYEKKLGNILQLENRQKLLTDNIPIDTTGEWVEPKVEVETFSDIQKAIEGASEDVKRFNGYLLEMKPDSVNSFQEAFDAVADSSKNASEYIEIALKLTQEYKRIISGMESGKIKFDKSIYDSAISGLAAVTEYTANYKKEARSLGSDVVPTQSRLESFYENIKKGSTYIENQVIQLREYKKLISDMESGKIDFDKSAYDEAVRGLDATTEAVKNYKEALSGTKKTETVGVGEIRERLNHISEGFENLSHSFGTLADKGINLFKKLVSPIKLASEEYVEKFQKMKGAVANFQKDFQTKMKKVSDFWKRTMRTFTFMIVRKAFTAVLKEINNATQSLAMYSNAMGTAFNTDLSNMVADFQYLGRSIVSVFAPLLNMITPIIDALVDKIATLISYIGMLFAALGGGSSFTKAKKNVSNYAESLDQASKSAKSLTMGIDELNVLNEKSGGGSAKPYDGWEDAWEEVDIPDSIKNLAQKMKDIFNALFEPLKKAWDKTKKYIISGWKYMTGEMKKLLGSVWDDFIEVWQGDIMAHVFTNLLLIVGDLEFAIGNLVRNFRAAWENGDKGFKILENIAKILDTITTHARNVSLYIASWTEDVSFDSLLESFGTLTAAADELADFVGGVFEDVMENVVLKYIEFLIEEGLPHLQHTVAEIIESFDFESLREKLKPVESAFEQLLENLDIGKTEALGNLGKMFADFTESEEFDNFLKTIEHMMSVIDAETVEKILTGIGMGIGKIADDLVKFVGSDTFNAFIDKLADWFKSVSAEDIANGLEKIAKAILMFKFAEFATEGLSGFFKFFGLLKGFTDIESIAKNMSLLGEGLGSVGAEGAAAGAGGTAAAGGLSAMAAPAALVASAIAAVALALFSMTKSYGGVTGLLDRLTKEFEKVSGRVKAFAEAIGLDDKIDKLKESISNLGEKLGGLKDFWDIIISTVGWVASVFMSLLLPAISVVIDTVTNFIDILSSLFEILGGVGELLVGVFTLDGDKIQEGFDTIIQGFYDFISVFKEDALGRLGSEVSDWAQGKKTALGDWLSSLKEFVSEKVSAIIDAVVQFFHELPGKLGYALGLVIGTFVKWGASIVEWIATNVPLFIDKIVSFFMNLPQKILEWLINTINSFNQWKSTTSSWIDTHIPKTIDEFVAYFKELSQKLWDLGTDIVSGLINGINDAWSKLKGGVANFCGNFIQGFKDAFKINSPSKETENVGDYLLQGLFEPFTKNQTAEIKKFTTQFIHVFETELSPRKFTAIGQQIIQGIMQPLVSSTDNVATAVNTIFIKIANGLKQSMQGMGTILSETLKSLTTTSIMPFFTANTWQPMFNNLMNGVFKPFITQFRTWFSKEAIEPWWKEDLITWFSDAKWNTEIFTPFATLLKGHWATFSKEWNNSLSLCYKAVQTVFQEIVKTISESMTKATKSVSEACDKMSKSFTNVLGELKDVMKNLKDMDLGDGNLKLNVGKPSRYATGGFPTQGTLFFAGESGAEFVSSVGGRTGVVSNNEITGIADAVYATGNNESELLAQLVAIGQAMLNKDPVVLSDKELAMAVKRGNNTMGMSIIT